VTRDSHRSAGLTIIFIAAVAAVAALAGCAGAPPDNSVNLSRDAFLHAYIAGMEQHAAGQGYFNNGTLAWEDSDYRAAIANYANASLNYSQATKDYTIMARYAREAQEKEFADSLRGCALNLSLASDNFVNAAIALGQNDSNTAYDWFSQGQARVDASEALLNRSIASTPGWLTALASG
jgi:hypothetical protein